MSRHVSYRVLHPQKSKRRLHVEWLEDRTVPTANWVGGDGDWSDASHWTGGTGAGGLPGANDDVVIDVAGTITVKRTQNVSDTIHSLANNETVQLNAGTLNIATTLGGTGTLQLLGGTLHGVTVQNDTTITGGSFSGGTLDGVTLNGTLDLTTVFGAMVNITGGLTLNGTMLVGASGGFGIVSIVGSQTLGGSGEVLFGTNPFNLVWTGAASGTVLTIGPDILVHGTGGTIGPATDVFPGTFGDGSVINQGTIRADVSGGSIRMRGTNWSNTGATPNGLQAFAGATLILEGSWSNAGNITAAPGSTLRFDGVVNSANMGTIAAAGANVRVNGTIDNAGQTLTLNDTTGSWRLESSGKILGGTLASVGTSRLIGAGGLLNGVTLNGNLDLASFSGAEVNVTGGLTLANSITLQIGSNSGQRGRLLFNGGNQTLGGTGNIVFGNNSANSIFTGQVAGTNLTIGPNILIHGEAGFLGANTVFFPGSATDGTLINQGTIDADVNGGAITFGLASWTNNGTIQAQNGGTIVSPGPINNFAAGALTGGTWKAFTDSQLRLIGANIATNAASIVLGGVNSNIFSDTGSTSALAGFADNAVTGSFTIQNGRNFMAPGAFSNEGIVTVGNGSTFATAAGNYTQTNGTTNLDGQLTATTVDIQGGTLQHSALPGLMTINGNYTQGDLGRLNVAIGGLTAGAQFDQFQVNGAVSLNGALSVSLTGGFSPQVGDSFRILDMTGAGSIGGSFTGLSEGVVVTVDSLPRFVVSYVGGTGNDVALTAINVEPRLDAITDPAAILEDAGLQTVNLTGINAGGGQTQTTTVSAVSNNPGLIPNPTVTYTSPDATGSLSYTPVTNQSGTATITVTITDDGGTANGGVDSFVRSFTVTVLPVNDAPTLDSISDPPPVEGVTPQTVNLTGITPGPNESQTLTVTAVSSNPSLIPDPIVIYNSPDSTGSLEFSPVPNQAGQAVITVTVTDNGGVDNGGVNSFSRTFAITSINDAPTLDPIDGFEISEDDELQTVNLTGITAGAGESQPLAVTATSNNPSLIPNPILDYISPNTTGSLHFAPVPNQHGSAIITVRVKDNGGTALGGVDEVTRTFTVNVSPQPDSPIVDTSLIRMLAALPLIPAPTNPAGSPVAGLLASATELDGEPLGIAITAIDNAKGKWQYSVNGGTDWKPVPANVSAAGALVLSDDSSTRVRFLPIKGFRGFSSFHFKVWDRSDNSSIESQVDIAQAPTAYSIATERAWIAVGKTTPAVNPSGATVLAAVREDSKASRTFTVKSLLGIAGLEQSPVTNLGIAITSASTASGKWQFRVSTSKSFVDVGAVSEAGALLLRPIDSLRFVPNANADGQADLTFKTWNQIGTPGDKVDSNSAGFSVNPGFATIDIVAINDAPVLDLSKAAVLDPVDPGQTTNEPTFASLMSATDVEGATLGVAIVAAKGAGWEFNTGNGWAPLGVVSSSKSLLLHATDQVRFVASTDVKRGTATLSFKAWDQFPGSGVAGTRVVVRGTAFSKQTEISTVAIDNDAPTLDTTPDVTLPSVVSTSTKPIAGTVVRLLLGTAFTDTIGSLKGIAIVAADNANGRWQYSLGGNVFIDIGAVGASSALLLTDLNKLRFVPNAGFTGQASIQFRAWDRTSGQPGDRINLSLPTNSFSVEEETASVTVL